MKQKKCLCLMCTIIFVIITGSMQFPIVERSLAQLPKKQFETPHRYPDVKPRTYPDIKAPTFESPDLGEVDLVPNSITIRYENRSLTLNCLGRGGISVPETGVDGQGKVPVTISFTLRNKTKRNFQFPLGLSYGGRHLWGTQVTLYPNQLMRITQQVALQPTTRLESFLISGPRGITDDAIISFCSAQLIVYVYPL